MTHSIKPGRRAAVSALFATVSYLAGIAVGVDTTPARAQREVAVQEVSYGEAINVRSGDGPVALGVGDFNHDRRKDLAVANLFGNDVSVMLSTKTGLRPASSVPVDV
jgi:hypothetical protein